MSHQTDSSYYVPHGTRWPIIGSLGMMTILVSAANWMNGSGAARWSFVVGIAILIYMLFGWFGEVIRESESGKYNEPFLDASLRLLESLHRHPAQHRHRDGDNKKPDDDPRPEEG